MGPGSTHRVCDYAPGGYKLAGTVYEDGAALHTFTCDGQPDLVCRVGAHDVEVTCLERFLAEHSPEFNTDHKPLKPRKRPSGNGG